MNRKRPLMNHKLTPWFISRDLWRSMQLLLPINYHERLRIYFDKYGCISCKRRKVPYLCNGLCLPCVGLIDNRLGRIDKLRHASQARPAMTSPRSLLRRRKSARDLLADFRKDLDKTCH